MKVRVMNNDLYSGMISQLGGNPSPMAFAEVYQSLKTGVVDGAENNWPSYESTGHYEVAGYYSLTQHLIIPECLCINADVYNDLSEEMKAAVTEAAVESAELQRELWTAREAASREKVEAGRRRHQRDRRQGSVPGGDDAGLRGLPRGQSEPAAAGRTDPGDRVTSASKSTEQRPCPPFGDGRSLREGRHAQQLRNARRPATGSTGSST